MPAYLPAEIRASPELELYENRLKSFRARIRRPLLALIVSDGPTHPRVPYLVAEFKTKAAGLETMRRALNRPGHHQDHVAVPSAWPHRATKRSVPMPEATSHRLTAMQAADRYRHALENLKLLEDAVLRLLLAARPTNPEELDAAVQRYRTAVEKIEAVRLRLEETYPVLRGAATRPGLPSPYPRGKPVTRPDKANAPAVTGAELGTALNLDEEN